ncbi:hypothetical protein RSSM_04459 [Rhodopirellula sallentina SM41]|uniref:Uncharacterized protein n=1 Tax=Rhodopirellula sallentina SM41 TaxID=1263870 RepID=M5TYH1_9BACT|nr:hypothetical protein RSSM_04459 [Rhodopirellula sallentina SM41]
MVGISIGIGSASKVAWSASRQFNWTPHSTGPCVPEQFSFLKVAFSNAKR